MKNLEQFLKNNREAFNNANASSNHFQKFSDKLQQEPQQPIFNIVAFIKIAAVILLVVIAGTSGYQIRKIEHQNMQLNAQLIQYQKAELYYTSNINTQMQMIRKLGSFDNNEHQQILQNELKEMDEKYQQLKKELDLYPNDERIINAMIAYYQVKTNILNQIIEQLYQVKKQTTKNVGSAA